MAQAVPAVPTAASVSLMDMPMEIQVKILSQLDLEGLLSTMLSCRHLYEVFVASSRPILSSLLHRDVDPLLSNEVLWCFKSLAVVGKDPQSKKDFLVTYDRHQESRGLLRSLELSLPLVSEYLKMVRAVEYWQSRVFQDFFSLFLDDISLAGACPDYAQELRTIEEALYRYEFLCNLFGKPQHVEDANLSSSIPYSYRKAHLYCEVDPIEIDQLQSLYVFFMKLVAPYGQYTCYHSLQFAKGLLENLNRPLTVTMHHHLQALAGHGLCYLQRVNQHSSKHKQRAQLPLMAIDHPFLMHDLSCLWSDERENFQTQMRGAVPADAYHHVARYACAETNPKIHVFRSCGYSFWQVPRLHQILPFPEREEEGYGGVGKPVLANASRRSPALIKIIRQAREPFHIIQERLSAVWSTMAARYCIYERGGRGWYEPKGKSDITWDASTPDTHYLPGEEPEGWTGRMLSDYEDEIQTRRLDRLENI